MSESLDRKIVSVIGLGYVGFPLACAIAKNKNYEVRGFDVSLEKIDKIKARISPIDDETAIQDIKTVSLQVDVTSTILKDSDIFIITVPTPIKNGTLPDLEAVCAAGKSIGAYLQKGKNQIVILESTVNPGVCEENLLPVLESVSGLQGGIDFELGHCPERINPGDSRWNVYNIPRNVGALTPHGTQVIAEFYRSIINAPIHEMASLKEVEATKIVENTFRDINIAFVNELAKSFDAMGLNVMNVLKGASNKPFAFMPHFPGCGVGGHCIAVDPYYLIERAAQDGFDHQFLKLARDINSSMPAYTVELLEKELQKLGIPLSGVTIGLLGLSYKKNIADCRESPALQIHSILVARGVSVVVFDPHVPASSTCHRLEDVVNNVDALIVATAHDEFMALNSLSLPSRVKVLVDGRNCLQKDQIQARGVKYKGVGC